MARLENIYQGQLIERIKERFPGCLVIKNDEQYLQGIPDLTILYGPHWAVLEVKRSEAELKHLRPNQAHYVQWLNGMGFSAFIYPENEAEVLDAIQDAFGA
jgi:hypothetical protein